MTAQAAAAGAAIRPSTDPAVPENHLRALLTQHNIAHPFAVVGIRGWSKSIAGAESEKNLIGVYDDPISVVTSDRAVTFPGNTDPSRELEGRAMLEPQTYWLAPGIHGRTRAPEKRRLAFIQASRVDIRRFDATGRRGPVLKDQWIGANLHDGSITTTGSEACQTVVPERWMECVAVIVLQLGLTMDDWAEWTARVKQGEQVPERWATLKFPYLLTD